MKRRRKTEMVSSAISAVGTAATFAAGQFDKAKTAWGEYEKGYEALGGEGFERPKFGQKGFFKGPEGEVSIGAGKERRTYDMGQVQKAGAFLGSDAASILSGDARSEYLQRTAPGRADPLTGKLQSSLTHMTGDTGTGFGLGPGMGFTGGAGKIGIESPDFLTGKSMGISDFEQSQMEFQNRQAGYKRSDEWAGKKRKEASLQERIRQERGKATLSDWQLEDLKGERATEQAGILEAHRSKTYESTAPTFSPEFLQKQQDYLQSPAYARYQEDQRYQGLNKQREDELARQFYNQNPKRNYLKTWEESNGY